MLTLKQIQDNTADTIARLAKKHFDGQQIINQIIARDNDRRKFQNQADGAQAEMNNVSKQIGQLMKEGRKAEAEEARSRTTELKESVRQYTELKEAAENELNALLVQLPNLPHTSVPEGRTPEDNLIVKEGGTIPALGATAMPHWDLARKYDIIDFELGTKITGAGFPVYKGQGAKLQRALINFFLDENEKAGFIECMPPLLVNEDSGFGTGQLPDKEGQMYHVGLDNFYLVPTAEVPVTNFYRDVIVEESQLPIKNTAYTPCFRREAGSYGKDVRGLNRLHQFDKVEIVQITKPDHSYEVLDEMVAHVEGLVAKLGLPYRILLLCGGDMSFTSAKTFDFEVYSAAQQRWLEVSSVSNFEAFQANRLKLRYRDASTKKPVLAHTLNGSSLALPRIVAALLENYQTADGIVIPEVLRRYTGFDRIG